MILLSHPTGNENVRQAALALQEADLLGEFWTCLNWNPDAMLNQLLPQQLRAQLARRSFPQSVRPYLHTAPVRELGRLLFGMFGIDAVLRNLDRKVAARLSDGTWNGVYAYEDCALESFRAAKGRAIRCIYDLPIGHWRAAQQIYREEMERQPQWAETLTGLRDSDEKLTRKEEELKLAEHVVVASSFTKQTLRGADFTAAVSVIPYGAPTISQREIAAHSGPLRILFAGSLGQRKGLSYLLQAVESVGRDKVELTLLGRKAAPNCEPLEAAVRRYRWIPTLPHQEVLREMQRHDVLVLPSLFEGFGLVILEAMAQGLVVIATPHTAAPDLIEDGVDGFIVPIRSSSAIAKIFEMLLGAPERLREMKLASRRKAEGQRWEVYRRSLAQMAQEVVS
jgi:glycosyltransferase involved in cell wall biosynthesis